MSDNKITKIEQKIEFARKRFYNFENSSFVFDSISPFWFLGRETSRNLTQLSTLKIFSDFVFSYLQFLSEIIEKKLNIKNISSGDLFHEEKLNNFKEVVASVFYDDLIVWINNVCIPNFTELVKRLNVTSYGELARLANLLQGEIRFLKNALNEESDNELLAYDVFYKIVDKITSYGFLSILDRTLFSQNIKFETNGEQIFRSVTYSWYKREDEETTIHLALLLAEVKIKQTEKQTLQLEANGGG